ncbi:MAG: tyrosine-type recombinase/integrase [Lachnospiraceae bacterium]|nr:tyrosine-type recombinase/integrase [Lachnospiraceae bacterium]
MLTTPIRSQAEIRLMKEYYRKAGRTRDYVLFVMGINTALRISDLIALQWEDVYNFKNDEYARHIYLQEQKTGKHNCIALNRNAAQALELLRRMRGWRCEPEEYIFYSGNNRHTHISRNRAWHIIKEAAGALGLEGNISCHSLRKTFGYHAWKVGTPPAVIMEIYNHSNLAITRRYLSITQDDYDEVFHSVNL